MRTTFLLSLAGVLFSAMPTLAQQAKRPNIVYIMADDLGINDLRCYGRKEHNTPNLDKLAQRGIRFTQAYAAQSVCSPTRAAIMSGLTPGRLHLTTFLPGRPDTVAQVLAHPQINQFLPLNVTTLAQRLRDVGYVSACIGKWHLGNGKGQQPTNRGFDLYHPGQALTKPSATEGGKGEYDLTATAEKFMEDNKNRPFFVYLCHNNPHIALAAKEELIAKNKNAFNPTYAAMVETLDDCVGRIVAKLEALGIADNTIVVFTSDNGGVNVLEGGQTPTFNWPFRAGKGFLYEGGLRIPLIVAWPGKVKEGRVETTPVISTDWTPTFLAMAGAKTTDKFDGISLAELILDSKAPPPRPLYWHQPHYTNQGSRPMGAMRDGPWKLIELYDDGSCELYNLDDDVGEANDLSAKMPARVAEMRGKLEAWRRDIGAQSNTANPDYNGALGKAIYRDVDVSRVPPDENAAAASKRLEAWRAKTTAVLPQKKSDSASGGAGAVILAAKDAKVHGDKLRFEPQPQKDTLGFWVNKNDWAEWAFTAPHKGIFEVEILQAAGKGSGGAEIELAIAGQTLTTKVEETGHFQRFVPRTIGRVELSADAPTTLTVRAKTKPGAAVMDLRRIVLRAAP
jgi:arylsulfatase A